MRRLARYFTVFLLTLLGVYALWFFRSIVVLLIASFAVSAMFRPIVDRLTPRFGRTPALLLTYLLAALGSALIMLTVGYAVLLELRELLSNLALRYEMLWRDGGNTRFERLVASSLPSPEETYNLLTGQDETGSISFGWLSSIGALLSTIPLVFFMSLYWGFGRTQIEHFALSLLSPKRRPMVRTAWQQTEYTIGAYLRGQFFQSVLILFLLWPFFALFGFNYPALMALGAAIVTLVPLVGALLGLLWVSTLSLAQGVVMLIVALVLTGMVLASIYFKLSSRLYEGWTYNPLLVVLLLVVLLESVGVAGLLVAPVFAALLQIVLGTLFKLRAANHSAETVQTLQDRSAKLRAEGELTPELSSILERLDGLILQAETNAS